jgi:hypothetical protein
MHKDRTKIPDAILKHLCCMEHFFSAFIYFSFFSCRGGMRRRLIFVVVVDYVGGFFFGEECDEKTQDRTCALWVCEMRLLKIETHVSHTKQIFMFRIFFSLFILLCIPRIKRTFLLMFLMLL